MPTRHTISRLSFILMLLVLGALAWSAYQRLQQAGCADWPACYFTPALPPQSIGQIELLVLIGLGILAWWLGRLAGLRRLLPGQPGNTPLVVMLFSVGHVFLLSHPLMSGVNFDFFVLASSLLLMLLLAWQGLRYSDGVRPGGWYARREGPADALRPWAVLIFLLLLAESLLGLWVSLIHAGLSCVSFAQCLAAWPEPLMLGEILAPASPEALEQARAALFLLHRAGALMALLAVVGLCAYILTRVFRCPALRQIAGLLLFVLPAQIVLGMGSLLSALPAWSVLAHFGLAGVSLLGLVVILHLLWPAKAHF